MALMFNFNFSPDDKIIQEINKEPYFFRLTGLTVFLHYTNGVLTDVYTTDNKTDNQLKYPSFKADTIHGLPLKLKNVNIKSLTIKGILTIKSPVSNTKSKHNKMIFAEQSYYFFAECITDYTKYNLLDIYKYLNSLGFKTQPVIYTEKLPSQEVFYDEFDVIKNRLDQLPFDVDSIYDLNNKFYICQKETAHVIDANDKMIEYASSYVSTCVDGKIGVSYHNYKLYKNALNVKSGDIVSVVNNRIVDVLYSAKQA